MVNIHSRTAGMSRAMRKSFGKVSLVSALRACIGPLPTILRTAMLDKPNAAPGRELEVPVQEVTGSPRISSGA